MAFLPVRPKYVVAPMVEQSELAFRLLCRRHGADLAVTPMFHSRLFSEDAEYRRENFQTCAEDRPLLVQFCGNDPQTMLNAAKFVENDCDGVDINLGCPQGIARKGRYGSFLLGELDLLERIVRTLSTNLKVPVTCKIRILPTLEATLKLAKTLEAAGCSMLTVHGRTKEQNKQFVGTCNWEWIKIIRETVKIPVIANGGIGNRDDIDRCLEETGVIGVMTSEAVLENPQIFEGVRVTGEAQDRIAREYLNICREHMPAHLKAVRAHIFKFLYTALQTEECREERDLLSDSATFEEIEIVVDRVAAKRRPFYGTPQDVPQCTWYSRHIAHNEAAEKRKLIADMEAEKTAQFVEEDMANQMSIFALDD